MQKLNIVVHMNMVARYFGMAINVIVGHEIS